ncbi:MAG: S1C family serine protease [Clostridiales bacterium]|jgi:serine protease Do|nr:S1C family serine protease [Clostridiales bacterium]
MVIYESNWEQLPLEGTLQEIGNPVAAHKKQKRSQLRIGTALLLVCVIFSSIFGFVGGLAANRGLSTTTNNAAPVVENRYSSTPIKLTSNTLYEQQTIPDVVEAVKPTVVNLYNEYAMYDTQTGQYVSEDGGGSGVIITSDGYIITNNHVVNGVSSIIVQMSDGTEYNATTVATDPSTDLAIIKIAATNLTPAVLGDSSSVLVGETGIAVGNPIGYAGSVSTGIISGLERDIVVDGVPMVLMQSDVAINLGNSGGGFFNLRGELLGLVSAKAEYQDEIIEGMSFIIPVNLMVGVVNELFTYGYVRGRIDTGLTLMDIQTAQMAMYYRVNALGLYISESTYAELQPGDLIKSVNGEDVRSVADFNIALYYSQVGDTITLTVSRNRQIFTTYIALREMRG